MTTRGKPAFVRPVTPPDPTLSSRPVPHTRHFPVQSFGAGASPDIQATARSLRDLDDEANPPPYKEPGDYCIESDNVHRLLEEVIGSEAVIYREDQENVPRNPTWGFYVFVTAYSYTARVRLSRAITALITALERRLRCFTYQAYSNEAIKRFKLGIVQDEDALANASDDRVRAEFRAYIRGLKIAEDDSFVPPARNQACLVFDEPSINQVADLSFPEDPARDYVAFGRDTFVKVLDIYWEYPGSSESPRYRGMGKCTVHDLPRLYWSITSNPVCMEESYRVHGSVLDV